MSERTDQARRSLTFRVDTAACETVVPRKHEAVRGYIVHKDGKTGREYGTAKRNGPRVADEGLRILQTKQIGNEVPVRIRTRKADVGNPLLAVCSLVDNGHTVLFDSNQSYCLHKESGRKTFFQRRGRGWVFTVELEAPEKANKVMTSILAELKEKAKASGNGVQTQPQQTIEINSAGEIEEIQFGDVERAQPLFRLAACQVQA